MPATAMRLRPSYLEKWRCSLALGSGLSQRDTLFWDRKMLPSRALIHVDLDPKVIGRTWHTEVPLVGDCGQVVRLLLGAEPPRSAGLAGTNLERRTWLEHLRSSGSRYYDEEHTHSDAVPLHPARVLSTAPGRPGTRPPGGLGGPPGFLRPYRETYAPRTYLWATNLGPMGWAIPAGLGARLARPDLPVVVVTGDGGMLMHGMEIQTAARYRVPVIFLVINNSALGNVWLRAQTGRPRPRRPYRVAHP